MQIFDRRRVRRNRGQAALTFDRHDFLLHEVQQQLLERLQDNKKTFQSVLVVGGKSNEIAQKLATFPQTKNARVVLGDWSAAWLKSHSPCVVFDDTHLPFASHTFDLILSLFSLHWIDQVPQALMEFKRILKADGLFLASFLGGETLKELRGSLVQAELNLIQGVSARIAPMIDLATASALLQKTGLALPVTDRDQFVVKYDSLKNLLHDLKGMGEGNGLLTRPLKTPRALFQEAEKLYEKDADGHLNATFEVISLTGWSCMDG